MDWTGIVGKAFSVKKDERAVDKFIPSELQKLSDEELAKLPAHPFVTVERLRRKRKSIEEGTLYEGKY